MADKTASA